MGLKGWERNRGANSLVTGSDLRRGVKTMMQNPLPFEEVMKDVLKVKPPEKIQRKSKVQKKS